MEDLEILIKKILRESKTIEEVENKLTSLKSKIFPDLDKLKTIMFNIVPSLKDSLFKSYQNYCMNYLVMCSVAIKNIKTDKRNLILYPIIFNIHQALELFFKAYKVFYHNLYGYDTEPFRAIRTSTPKEIDIIGHDVEKFFTDKDILFVFDLFGIDNTIAKTIEEKYYRMKSLVGFECLSENARYPQGNKEFLPMDATSLQNEDINEIFTIIEELIRILNNSLLTQYEKKNIDKSSIEKLLNRRKSKN